MLMYIVDWYGHVDRQENEFECDISYAQISFMETLMLQFVILCLEHKPIFVYLNVYVINMSLT